MKEIMETTSVHTPYAMLPRRWTINGDKKNATPTEMANAIQLPAILFASCLSLDIGLWAISSAAVGLDYSFNHAFPIQKSAIRV